jgi:hypothetical protein
MPRKDRSQMAKTPCGSGRESRFGKAERANEDRGKESGPKHPAPIF